MSLTSITSLLFCLNFTEKLLHFHYQVIWLKLYSDKLCLFTDIYDIKTLYRQHIEQVNIKKSVLYIYIYIYI